MGVLHNYHKFAVKCGIFKLRKYTNSTDSDASPPQKWNSLSLVVDNAVILYKCPICGGVLLLAATLAAYATYATLGDTSKLSKPNHTGDDRSDVLSHRGWSARFHCFSVMLFSI